MTVVGCMYYFAHAIQSVAALLLSINHGALAASGWSGRWLGVCVSASCQRVAGAGKSISDISFYCRTLNNSSHDQKLLTGALVVEPEWKNNMWSQITQDILPPDLSQTVLFLIDQLD